MGAPTLIHVAAIPGRLSYGCTDLTTAWPHGGTGLGLTSRIEVHRFAPIHEVSDGAHGVEPKNLIHGGERWALLGVLRDWDADALGQVFPNTATGSVTGYPVIQMAGSNRAGYEYGGASTVVVFTPQSLIDGNEDQHQMVVLYDAMPHVEAQMRMRMDLAEERAVPVAYLARRDTANDRVGEIGFRRDLTSI